MMQRDEETLLDSWFRYYGHLFGFDSLSVFDNRSMNPDVIATLKKYEALGSRIYWGFDRVEDFEGKGFHFANVIRSWDYDLDYDFAIPLDCDEFLAVFTPHGLSCDRQTIHDYLDSLIGSRQAIGIEWSLYNVPAQPGWFRPELYRKGFFPSRSIEFLDHGFHEPRSRAVPGRRETHLAYVHLHNKSYLMTLEHAKRKLAHFVDVEDRDAVKAYVGPGSHLINHFVLTEEQFLGKYETVVTVWFGAFVRLLVSLAATWPDLASASTAHPLESAGGTVVRFPHRPAGSCAIGEVAFDAKDYVAANPDVAGSSSTPLMHFIRFGHGEGRPLSATSPDGPDTPGGDARLIQKGRAAAADDTSGTPPPLLPPKRQPARSRRPPAGASAGGGSAK